MHFGSSEIIITISININSTEGGKINTKFVDHTMITKHTYTRSHAYVLLSRKKESAMPRYSSESERDSVRDAEKVIEC